MLVGYASGLTLKATARRAGITVNTAKYYLDRVKTKYQDAGRPTYTKIDLALRVREDGWGTPGRSSVTPVRPPVPGREEGGALRPEGRRSAGGRRRAAS
ncbi:hypothetical protein AB0E67_15710 [Streptomyces sp. NPDC032161]|uniref:helix-turn-helix transcriptional regulator n=1 Tax=unclassified Streptomyces TaxID=2593676 RepID=UPI0033C080FE